MHAHAVENVLGNGGGDKEDRSLAVDSSDLSSSSLDTRTALLELLLSLYMC
jgi:hypothetical protein